MRDAAIRTVVDDERLRDLLGVVSSTIGYLDGLLTYQRRMPDAQRDTFSEMVTQLRAARDAVVDTKDVEAA